MLQPWYNMPISDFYPCSKNAILKLQLFGEL